MKQTNVNFTAANLTLRYKAEGYVVGNVVGLHTNNLVLVRGEVYTLPAGAYAPDLGSSNYVVRIPQVGNVFFPSDNTHSHAFTVHSGDKWLVLDDSTGTHAWCSRD